MGRTKKASRIDGPFIALPHYVVKHAAYRGASVRSRCLLTDVALQYNGKNNGALVVCDKAMKPLGWTSNDGLTKSKRELLTLRLLVETRKGARPNKAAWYALAWLPLQVTDGIDIDPRAYLSMTFRKIEVVTPSGGVGVERIAPPHGVRTSPTTPSHGAI